MTKANVTPNVPPNVSDIHTYTLRTLLRVYRRTDDGKKQRLTNYIFTVVSDGKHVVMSVTCMYVCPKHLVEHLV